MKSIKYLSLSALVMFGLSSCSDFLDTVPDERVEIQTELQVKQLLRNCYPDGNYGWLCEISSDNLMDNNAPHMPASTQSKQVEARYNLSPYDRMDDELFAFEPVRSSNGSDSPTSIWENYYSSIASVNHALEAIDRIAKENNGVMSNGLRASRAEALILRAYDHFILVNIFCQAYKNPEASKEDIGVPYVTEPETSVHVNYDRSTVADTYAKIQADLEEGLKDLTDVNFEKPKWYFNTKAAHAFAARFYLFTRQYDKVLEHANAVLGTDDANTLSMLMKNDGFGGFYYADNFADYFQGPDQPNNLMLLDTYSAIWRRSVGYRYSMNSFTAREIYYHNMPLWNSWAINPTQIVEGLFGNGDYGYVSPKIAEKFQYSDKLAGIGYAHIIRREFTCNELLLERIEAEIMTGKYSAASSDLTLFTKSMFSYSESDMTAYFSNDKMKYLDDSVIQSWFAKATNYNCFENWDFTQNMSADFIIPAEAVPYMNCLNYFRRWETQWDGLRFFDLKRWGIEYSHVMGADRKVYKLTWNDPRRAIEIPQEVIAAGLPPSRPTDSATAPVPTIEEHESSDFENKPNIQ